MIRRPIVLKNGRLHELSQGDSIEGMSSNSLSLCDISLFVVGLNEVLLTNQFGENLSDQHGFPLGEAFAMMPNDCLNEYNDGLTDQNNKYLFGTEGEYLT